MSVDVSPPGAFLGMRANHAPKYQDGSILSEESGAVVNSAVGTTAAKKKQGKKKQYGCEN